MRSKFLPFVAAAALAASVFPAAAYQAYLGVPANVRVGPGVRFPVVATVPAGGAVDVGLCRPGWCQVQFMGGNGFIDAGLLVAGAPAVATTAAAGPFDFLTAPFTGAGAAYAGTPAAPVAPPPPPAGQAPVVAAY
jgi:uncharacterized protein YraI